MFIYIIETFIFIWKKNCGMRDLWDSGVQVPCDLLRSPLLAARGAQSSAFQAEKVNYLKLRSQSSKILLLGFLHVLAINRSDTAQSFPSAVKTLHATAQAAASEEFAKMCLAFFGFLTSHMRYEDRKISSLEAFVPPSFPHSIYCSNSINSLIQKRASTTRGPS
jgi:hypothetical protein